MKDAPRKQEKKISNVCLYVGIIYKKKNPIKTNLPHEFMKFYSELSDQTFALVDMVKFSLGRCWWEMSNVESNFFFNSMLIRHHFRETVGLDQWWVHGPVQECAVWCGVVFYQFPAHSFSSYLLLDPFYHFLKDKNGGKTDYHGFISPCNVINNTAIKCGQRH